MNTLRQAVHEYLEIRRSLGYKLQGAGTRLLNFVSFMERRRALSVHGVKYLLSKYSTQAARACPSLKGKRVTVHLLRHTMAMELLQSGVSRAVIALWLGHESVETTQIYLEATLAMKEQALAKTSPAKWQVVVVSLSPERSAAQLSGRPVASRKTMSGSWPRLNTLRTVIYSQGYRSWRDTRHSQEGDIVAPMSSAT